MPQLFQDTSLAFLSLLVAFDLPGILPLLLGLLSPLQPPERKTVINQSLRTAGLLSVAFLLAGRVILQALQIEPADFQIAGGLLLFLLAAADLLSPNNIDSLPPGEMGVFPIGTPLLVGPAVLTILLVLQQNYGPLATAIALVLNLILLWLAFRQSERIYKLLGRSGSMALAKVSNLLLAAVAVRLVHAGLDTLLKGSA